MASIVSTTTIPATIARAGATYTIKATGDYTAISLRILADGTQVGTATIPAGIANTANVSVPVSTKFGARTLQIQYLHPNPSGGGWKNIYSGSQTGYYITSAVATPEIPATIVYTGASYSIKFTGDYPALARVESWIDGVLYHTTSVGAGTANSTTLNVGANNTSVTRSVEIGYYKPDGATWVRIALVNQEARPPGVLVQTQYISWPEHIRTNLTYPEASAYCRSLPKVDGKPWMVPHYLSEMITGINMTPEAFIGMPDGLYWSDIYRGSGNSTMRIEGGKAYSGRATDTLYDRIHVRCALSFFTSLP